jgi:hypothetical protein
MVGMRPARRDERPTLDENTRMVTVSHLGRVRLGHPQSDLLCADDGNRFVRDDGREARRRGWARVRYLRSDASGSEGSNWSGHDGGNAADRRKLIPRIR